MPGSSDMVLCDVKLLDGRQTHVRISAGRIVEMGAVGILPGDTVLQGGGGLLIPGLHDHHLHLAATCASRGSVPCGPPDVIDRNMLERVLRTAGTGWLRGVAYHESVAGMLERVWLDKVAGDRPVRIQHRSGRMWFLNSVALDQLLASRLEPPEGLDRESGQLFEGDAWLRQALGGRPPALDDLGADMARLGLTGVTDMGPANAAAEYDYIKDEQARGALPQRVVLAGTLDLASLPWDPGLRLGPVKLHLHEARLPDYNQGVALARAAHDQDRGLAVHCVTYTELVFALTLLREAGIHPDDRIEHAAVAPDELIAQIAEMDLTVAVQPQFVMERGDAYRRDIAREEWPHLYRLRAFQQAGVALGGSSDAPYVDIDPWRGMLAATMRRTASGQELGAEEALDAEAALGLYLTDPLDLRRMRQVKVGEAADLCLLHHDWPIVREDLSARHVAMTIISGRVVYKDQK